jgi:hypothetical protein
VGQPLSRDLFFSSSIPFRIVKVETESTALKVKIVENNAKTMQTLHVTLTASQAGQYYTGTLHVYTDMLNQEVIEIPYSAYSQSTGAPVAK